MRIINIYTKIIATKKNILNSFIDTMVNKFINHDWYIHT